MDVPEPTQMNEAKPHMSEVKPSPPKARRRKSKLLTRKRKKSALPEIISNKESTTVDDTDTQAVENKNALSQVKEATAVETNEATQPESQEDAVPVVEGGILPVVKEEPEIHLIDNQESVAVLTEPPRSGLEKSRLPKKSFKSGKKRRRSFIGQRSKQKLKSREQKVSDVPEKEICEDAEVFDEVPTPTELSIPSSRSKLIGVHKKYKRPKSLQMLSRRPKAQSEKLSKVVEMEFDKEGLKQEETDTLVDEVQLDVLDTQPGKAKFLKNIKHFIMPVVSARSSRVIKTPQRFMDDAGMSVLPRRNSPKKGVQLGLPPPRPVKRQEDEVEREPSPDLPDEDLLDDADFDMDLFSLQGLDDNTVVGGKFIFEKPGKSEKRRSLLRNPSFKWHVPGESGEEVYTLNKPADNKLYSLNKPAEKLENVFFIQFI